MSEYYEHMGVLGMERERLYVKKDIEEAYKRSLKATKTEDEKQRMKINNARKFLIGNLFEFIRLA